MSGGSLGFRGLLLDVGRRRTEHIGPEFVAGYAGSSLDSEGMLRGNRPTAVYPLAYRLRRNAEQPCDTGLPSPMSLNCDGDCVHGDTKASLKPEVKRCFLTMAWLARGESSDA